MGGGHVFQINIIKEMGGGRHGRMIYCREDWTTEGGQPRGAGGWREPGGVSHSCVQTGYFSVLSYGKPARCTDVASVHL